jgi:hypothetical protein
VRASADPPFVQSTAAQNVTEGQDTDLMRLVPSRSLGAVHEVPFQVRASVPLTATQNDIEAHETDVMELVPSMS